MRLSLLSGVALAFVPAIVHAQEASDSGFDEIIVTATRGPTNLQDTPIAVSAISADQMEERGVQSIRDLANVVPSLQINQQTNAGGAGSVAIWIRGLGQERSMLTTQPSVPLYIDDFYYPSLGGNVLRAMDIEGVEVLRGPQGTLFGRNSTGGAVRYTTRKPNEDFEGYVEGTAGSYDRADIVGVLNVPLTDELYVRLSAASMNTDGFVDYDRGGEGGATENQFGRIAVRYAPSDNLTFDLSHEETLNTVQGSTQWNDVIDGMGSLVGLYNLAGGTPPYNSAFDSSCATCAPGGLPIDDYARSNVYNTHFVGDWNVSDSLQLKLLVGRSLVTESWSNDVDSSPAQVGRQYQPSARAEATSYELQALGSFGDRVRYVVGAYYYDESQQALAGQAFTFPVALGVGVLLTQEARAHTFRTSQSIYGNFTFDLTNALSLTTGVRVLEDTVDADIQATFPAPGPIGRASRDDSRTLPMVRVQYDWSDDIMTYASASQGYRGGGYAPVSSSAELMPFAPESVWSYEVGARMEFLDRIRVNPTIFYMDYEDIQLGVQYTPNPMSAPTLILTNGGRAHIYGFELDSSFNVTDNFSLNFSTAITEGGYDEISPLISNITLDSPIPHVAKNFYAIGGRYRIPFESGAQTIFNLDYNWRSEQHSSANNQDDLIIDAYGTLNGQIMYDSPSGAWSIAVFGTNLTDEEYFTGGLNLTALVGNHRYDIGRPQEFGIRTQINF